MGEISDYVSESEMRDVRSRFENDVLAKCVIENMARIRGYVKKDSKGKEKHLYETDYKFL